MSFLFENKLNTNKIHKQIDRIHLEENKFMLQQNKDHQKTSSNVASIFILSTFLILLLMLTLLSKLKNEIKKRLVSEFELIQLKDGLVMEVATRSSRLIESRNKLSETLERITDAFVSIDNKWCYTYLNKKAGEIFNRDPEKLIGKNIWEEFPEGINQPFYHAYYKAMKEQEYIYLEEYYPPYDAWFENHIYPSPNGLTIYFKDISEKKKAEILLREKENQIKESEELYHSIFNNSGEAILLTISDGRILSANPEAVKIFGWSEEEICKLGRKGILCENNPNLSIALEERKKTGRFKGEFNFIRKDNSEFLGEVASTIFTASNGEERTSMIIRDISERRKTEDELRKSEDRFRSLIEQASDAIVTADKNGNLLEVNSSFCELLGAAKEEIINQNIRSFMEPKQLASEPLRFDLLYKNINIIRERKMVRMDGTLVDVEVNVKMLTDGRLLSIFRDVSERKKTEKQLKESEVKFRHLFERNLAGIFQSNVKGNIITCNPAFSKILGYDSPLELINKHASMLYFSESDRNKFINTIREKQVLTFFESILKNKNGEPVYVIENSTLIKDPLTDEELLEGVLVDITEQKKIDFDLAIAHQKLTFHLNNSPLGIIEWDKNFLIQKWSSRSEHIFGWKESEVINKNFKDLNLVFEEDLLEVFKVAEDLMSGNYNSNNSTNRNNTKSGEVIYCQWFNSVLIDETGNIQSILSLILDITENKKAEKALVTSENHLRTILQTEPQCIKLLGKNNELLDMNPAGLAMVEADSLEQLKGKSILGIVDDPYKKAFTQLTQDIFKGDAGWLEFEITGLKGTYRWLETNAVPLKNADDTIYSLLGVTRDITERKKAEIKLIESEEKFRTLVDLAPIGIFFVKPDGEVTYGNAADLKMTGLTWEEMEGFNWINAIHPDDRNKVIEDWKKSQETGLPYKATGRYLHKDGKIIHWDVSTAPIIVEGKNIGYIGIVLDVTDRIKTEEEIISTSKQLRQLSTHLQNIREEERTHIAREIHDELGQSLTALKMDVSWIKKKSDKKDEFIQEKLTGMISLINDTVQTVRRISSELRPSIIDDLGLISALEWQSHEFEKRTSIKCSFKSGFNELTLNKGSSIGIFRVFQEALTNIARHAKASEVESVIEKNDKHIFLKIKDNGIGFKMNQTKNSNTLGLVGMRERAIMLGGQLNIESTIDNGTEITLEIPFDLEKLTNENT